MRPLLVRVERMGAGPQPEASSHVFTSSPVRLGRNNLNDLPLDDPFVSLWHGMLQFDDTHVQYLDLGSTNGSKLDGTPAPANQLVSLGGEVALVLGPLRLRVARGDASSAAPKPHHFTLFDYKVAKEPQLINEAALFRAPAPTLHFEARAEAPKAPEAQAPWGPDVALAATAAPSPAAERGPTTRTTPLSAPSEAAWAATTANALLPRYMKYREGWDKLQKQLSDALAAIPEARRAPALALLRAKLPALGNEPAIREWLGEGNAGRAPPSELPPSVIVAGVTPSRPRTDPPRRGDATLLDFPAQGSEAAPPGAGPADGSPAAEGQGLLALFAETYAPGPARSARELEQFLRQLSQVLEAFAQAFVELRRGQQEFVRQMAVPAPGDSALRRASTTARELLKFLLEPTNESGRVRELTRGFADVMVHQVGLLSGLREGVRALLEQLNPERFAGGSKWLPLGAAASLRRYEARYRELTEEERGLEGVLFGPEFAFAYTRIVGGPPLTPPHEDPGSLSREVGPRSSPGPRGAGPRSR